MFLIYSFIYVLAILFLFIPQYLGRPKEYRKRWLREKLGSVPRLGPAIWVHAVSVGEVGASITLIGKLRDAYPALSIVLSTITDTGQKVAIEKAPSGTTVVYLPFDAGFVLRRCLRRVHPVIFITIETEIWPNIIRIFAGRRIPVVMLNGRISEKSAQGYRRIAFFMKKVFMHVKIFGMQSAADAARLKEIGAAGEKVLVTGNFKFDMPVRREIPAWAAGLKGPVIVAGSTHSGEEALIISALRENLPRFPGLKLILAPRHPERFAEAGEAVKAAGLPLLNRSQLGAGGAGIQKFDSGVILLDSVGELSSVYGAADIAVIGKSFIGFGGQNPLEPAFWGKAIICGPHMENFPFMRDFYREGAAFEVEPTGLAKKLKELLLDPEKAEAAGQKARELYLKNAGAVDRAMEIIREAMQERGGC
jgi:3-deoxy-D-manno-octulosonic-acid transferase